MMRSGPRGGALVGLLVLLAAAPLSAQTGSSGTSPSDRPWAGLAPGRATDPGLTSSADVFGGYSVATLPVFVPAEDGVRAEREDWSGPVAGANASANYATQGQSFQFGAGGAASIRYLAGAEDDFLPSYSGTARLASTGGRLSASVQQSISYGPLNALPFFGGAAGLGGLPAVDYRLIDQSQFAADTTGSIDVNLSRSTQLSFSASYGITDVIGTPSDLILAQDRFDRRSVNGRLNQRLGRYSNIYAGYGYGTGRVLSDEVGPTATPAVRNIDAGFGYARPLSFSRRTQVAFQIGAAAFDQQGGASDQYTAVGSASIQREVGRGGTVRLSVARDIRFISAVFQPVTSNSATAQALGTFGRALSLSVTGNYADGQIGGADDSDFRLLAASAQVRYALGARVSTFSEYFYLDSTSDASAGSTTALAFDTRTHGVRVGLTIGDPFSGTRRR
jgi:hypothetical protein